jgi:cell division protein FtsW
MLRRKSQTKKATKTSNKPFDFVLLVTVLVLLGMGIVMVLSASSPSALATTGSSYTFVSRQALAAILGIALMLMISKFDYKQYPKFYKAAYVVSVVGLLLVLIPGLRKNSKLCNTLDKLAASRFISTIRDYKNRNGVVFCSVSITA